MSDWSTWGFVEWLVVVGFWCVWLFIGCWLWSLWADERVEQDVQRAEHYDRPMHHWES